MGCFLASWGLHGCLDLQALEIEVYIQMYVNQMAPIFNLAIVSGAVWKYMSGCVLLIFGLPLNWVAGASLYSKLLPMPVQGKLSF